MTTNSILLQMPLDLGNNLILRFAGPDDVDALADFNARIFNDQVGQWTRDLMSGQHPTVQASDFTVVEDTCTHKIVSSMNLISQTWAYGGIPFQVGRPEIVGTDPAYRRRGLVRKQFEVIHALSATRCELMQGITGIPWYYRQFGYEMAMHLGSGRRVDVKHHIPRLKEGETEAYCLRPAAANDHAFVRAVYDGAISRQPFAALRSPKEWDYEFSGRDSNSVQHREWLIVETADGERLGYVQLATWWHETILSINQIELKPGVGYLNLMPSLLRGLWAHAQRIVAGRNPSVKLDGLLLWLGVDHPVYHVLPNHSTSERKPYAWYIRVPDIVAFLRHIRPALEKNLWGTIAEGYSGDLKLSFYRSGIHLKFERGKITEILSASPESNNARLPDLIFLQLLCGRRRFSELAESFPDCGGTDEAAVLLDCLFPPFTGNVWELA